MGPCPWVSCRHHLAIDWITKTTGEVRLAFPDVDVLDLEETCSLRVANHGGHELDVVGRLMNLHRQHVFILETDALAKMKPVEPGRKVRERADGKHEPRTLAVSTIRARRIQASQEYRARQRAIDPVAFKAHNAAKARDRRVLQQKGGVA